MYSNSFNESWKQKSEVAAVTLISLAAELGQISYKSISYLVSVASLNKDGGKFRGFLISAINNKVVK